MVINLSGIADWTMLSWSIESSLTSNPHRRCRCFSSSWVLPGVQRTILVQVMAQGQRAFTPDIHVVHLYVGLPVAQVVQDGQVFPQLPIALLVMDGIHLQISLVQVTLTKQEFIDLKWQVNHYRDLWKRTRVREQELLATIALMKKDNKA